MDSGTIAFLDYVTEYLFYGSILITLYFAIRDKRASIRKSFLAMLGLMLIHYILMIIHFHQTETYARENHVALPDLFFIACTIVASMKLCLYSALISFCSFLFLWYKKRRGTIFCLLITIGSITIFFGGPIVFIHAMGIDIDEIRSIGPALDNIEFEFSR